MIVEERDRQSRLEHNMAYRFAKATAEMRFFCAIVKFIKSVSKSLVKVVK